MPTKIKMYIIRKSMILYNGLKNNKKKKGEMNYCFNPSLGQAICHDIDDLSRNDLEIKTTINDSCMCYNK